MRIPITPALALLLLVGPPSQTLVGQIPASERLKLGTTLSLVKHFGITVSIDSEISPFVSEDQISRDTELAMRTHGVPFSSDPKDFDQSDGGNRDVALLSINVGVVESQGLYAVHISARLREYSSPTRFILSCANTTRRANPTRDETVVYDCLDLYSVLATVWERDNLWILGKNKLGQVRDSAKDLVEEFILDWVKVHSPIQ